MIHINWIRGFQKMSVSKAFICFFIPILLFTPFVEFQPGLGDSGGKLGPLQKILVFIKSPVAKYVTHLFSYLAMAGLHSYVAMFSYRWEYLPSEWLLYAWICVLAVTEVKPKTMSSGSS